MMIAARHFAAALRTFQLISSSSEYSSSLSLQRQEFTRGCEWKTLQMEIEAAGHAKV